MPPKTQVLHYRPDPQDQGLHETIFTKAVRGTRTMNEVFALIQKGTPIPYYDYPLGESGNIALTDAQKVQLNEAGVTAEDLENNPSHHALWLVWDSFTAWPDLLEQLGEPRPTDASLSWSIYDLLRILDKVQNTLDLLTKILNNGRPL